MIDAHAPNTPGLISHICVDRSPGKRMTAPNSRDEKAISAGTTPLHDFEEFDKNALLSWSPSLSELCYPFPAPSISAGACSLASNGVDISQEDMTFIGLFPYSPQDYVGESSENSYVPIASVPEQDVALLTTSNTTTHPPTQSQWSFDTAVYSQPSPVTPYDHTPITEYPLFETSMPLSLTNSTPQEPQEVVPIHFDFESPPTFSTSLEHSTTTQYFSQHNHGCRLSSTSRPSSPTRYQRTNSSTPSILSQDLLSDSTSSNSSPHACGILQTVPDSVSGQPVWSCAYPGCTSKITFTRFCDLRKHYNRHSKHWFCRIDGCPRSQAAAVADARNRSLSGGFGSSKDRLRHEATHNPRIKCDWKGLQGEECGQVFSRMDNMKDHVRRIHKTHEQKSSRS